MTAIGPDVFRAMTRYCDLTIAFPDCRPMAELDIYLGNRTGLPAQRRNVDASYLPSSGSILSLVFWIWCSATKRSLVEAAMVH